MIEAYIVLDYVQEIGQQTPISTVTSTVYSYQLSANLQL